MLTKLFAFEKSTRRKQFDLNFDFFYIKQISLFLLMVKNCMLIFFFIFKLVSLISFNLIKKYFKFFFAKKLRKIYIK